MVLNYFLNKQLVKICFAYFVLFSAIYINDVDALWYLWKTRSSVYWFCTWNSDWPISTNVTAMSTTTCLLKINYDQYLCWCHRHLDFFDMLQLRSVSFFNLNDFFDKLKLCWWNWWSLLRKVRKSFGSHTGIFKNRGMSTCIILRDLINIAFDTITNADMIQIPRHVGPLDPLILRTNNYSARHESKFAVLRVCVLLAGQAPWFHSKSIFFTG